MILLIDNYDSFTWNLVQRLGEIDPALEPGQSLIVARHDAITPDQAEALDSGRGPTHVIISPGPCTPREAGVSPDIMARFAGRVPVLGVCLGHQCLGFMHGMVVERHAVPVHGKTSPIHHDGQGLYAGLSNPFQATRYHSLVIRPDTVPPPPAPGADGWIVSAWTDEPLPDGSSRRVIMGIRRVWADSRRALLEGVQYHPESFLTLEGPKLLKNFLNATRPNR